jgi:dTDP-4-amino-4,6-dideoxygalactose transaminase
LRVIEDCTHALGATDGDLPVGAFGDAAFFSSEQTKVISTGLGGVAYTKDADIAVGIDRFHSRCNAPDSSFVRKLMVYLAYTVVLREPRLGGKVDGLGYYLQRLGLMTVPVSSDEEMRCEMPPRFEMRMTGAQARVGSAQLRRMPANLARRREIAGIYFRAFADTRIGMFIPRTGTDPTYVRFPIRVRDKQAFSHHLRKERIQAGLWFTAPVHPAGVPQNAARYVSGSCPCAEEAVATVANLPCHPRMAIDDAEHVARVVLSCEHA